MVAWTAEVNVWLLWWLAACEPRVGEVVPPSVSISGFRSVVPSDGLPAEAAPNQANNNLDLAWWDGRWWLAWRTADTHFAGPEVRMVIVSSEDEVDWRYEGEVAIGTDVREPQLVVVDDALRLYFTRLGDDPLAFTPGGMMMTTRRGVGEWTAPVDVFDEGFLAWRIKTMGGRLNVIGYEGGENIYTVEGDVIRVRWQVTDDGEALDPAFGDDAVVLEGGGSETDIVPLDDGRYVAVVRNEAGDDSGFGSKICTSSAEDPMDWACSHDPRKFDSPLLLRAAGRVWLIARRNVTESGHFDLGMDDLSFEQRFLTYQVAYWQEPKRCAVWVVDPDERTVTWVEDLPSAGDTCFPEAVHLGGERWLLYSYTSDPARADIAWLEGQTGPTWVVRQEVEFH
jgi:hypothetical protein